MVHYGGSYSCENQRSHAEYLQVWYLCKINFKASFVLLYICVTQGVCPAGIDFLLLLFQATQGLKVINMFQLFLTSYTGDRQMAGQSCKRSARSSSDQRPYWVFLVPSRVVSAEVTGYGEAAWLPCYILYVVCWLVWSPPPTRLGGTACVSRIPRVLKSSLQSTYDTIKSWPTT